MKIGDKVSAEKPQNFQQKTFSHLETLEKPFEFLCYPLLQTSSRRAIQRFKKKWGWAYIYKPRADLITRLSEQLGMSRGEVRVQLQRERNHLLQVHSACELPRVK